MACPHMEAETLFRSYCLAYDPQSAVVPAADGAFEQLRGFGEGDVRWMGHHLLPPQQSNHLTGKVRSFCAIIFSLLR